jgi:ABC-type sugar transport system substrate-binding protein
MFSGCGGSGGGSSSSGGTSGAASDSATESEGDGELGSYYIAYDMLGSDWILQYMEQRGKWAVEHAGDNRYDYYSADFSADTMQTQTQSMISAGIDGLMYYGAYPTLTPTITEMCESAKLPFVMHDMPPSDDQKPALQASPYFVGFIASSGYDNGYQLGEEAAKDGYKKALAIGGHVGDPTMDARIKGFKEAFEKGGGQLLDEARCTNPGEAVQKSGDILTAHQDADCLFAATGAYALGTLSSMENLKREIYIYSIDMDSDLLPYVKGGTMKGNGGAVVATILSAALLQNWLDGHPITDADGKPFWNTDIRNILVTAENADDFNEYIIQNEPLTEEFFRTFVWRYNNDVTAQTYIDFGKAYNLDYIKQIHGQ